MPEDTIYKGRDYEESVMKAVRSAKSRAEYPDTPTLQGLQTLYGERYVFNYLIKDELRKARVPKPLIKKLTKKAK